MYVLQTERCGNPEAKFLCKTPAFSTSPILESLDIFSDYLPEFGQSFHTHL